MSGHVIGHVPYSVSPPATRRVPSSPRFMRTVLESNSLLVIRFFMPSSCSRATATTPYPFRRCVVQCRQQQTLFHTKGAVTLTAISFLLIGIVIVNEGWRERNKRRESKDCCAFELTTNVVRPTRPISSCCNMASFAWHWLCDLVMFTLQHDPRNDQRRPNDSIA